MERGNQLKDLIDFEVKFDSLPPILGNIGFTSDNLISKQELDVEITSLCGSQFEINLNFTLLCLVTHSDHFVLEAEDLRVTANKEHILDR